MRVRILDTNTAMTPDANQHNPSPDYLRDLIARSGLSQRECARVLGIGWSTMKDYLNSSHPSAAPYAVQFALEQLAAD